MAQDLGPYEVTGEERAHGYLHVYRVRGPAGAGRLYWFEVKNPEARAAFFRFRKALKALSGLGALPPGVEISAKPGRYYVFWPELEAPSALPAKGRRVVREVGRIVAALAPLGYALPDADLRLTEEGVRVAALDPLAEHDEAEAERLGGRFLKALPHARSRVRRPWQAWIPGLVALVVGFMLLGFGVDRYLNPPEYVLPDLRGQDPRGALEAVRDMGLRVVFVEASNPEKPRDVVLEQNPPPGTRVKPGRKLELTLNRPKTGTVPDLTDLPAGEALRKLEESGYVPAAGAEGPSDLPEGRVLATAPPAEAPLPQGASVRVLTSAGTPPERTVLPDLTGLSLDDARYLLSVADLRLGDVQEVPAPEPEGTVLSQSPPAGVALDVGSPVTVTVATRGEVLLPENATYAPPPPPDTAPENPAPTGAPESPPVELGPGERIVPIRVPLPQGTGGPVHVRLVVEDEAGRRVPIDTYAPGGTTLEGSVKVKGTARFQLFLDEFLYQQWTSQAP
ncbi:PASTA domain-containing protein [Oceanithermus sp.]|uniref:PASTA domain-containing protein n=1 Tax=Oceanithermus sp. TaxID=2268145 RepID=UPI0025D060E9|nr:PASTA domain-containing protein [Oceanithermus sp.]